MLNEETIREALRDCYDPDIRLDLVELGMVESVTLVEDHDAPGAGIVGVPMRYQVKVELLKTGRDEAAEAQLLGQVKNRLAGIYEVSSAAVVMKDEPMWTAAQITASGRRALGLDQPVFPILNNKVRTF